MRSFERIVAASPGGRHGAVARFRLGPLEQAGRWPIDILDATSLPRPADVSALLERGGSNAILLLQRVLPSRAQLRALRRAYPRIVFDFDDALYAVPPRVGRRGRELPKAVLRLLVRGSPSASVRARPLARVLREADVSVAGNELLAGYARRRTRRVVEIPTTVEPLERPSGAASGPTIVWIGLPDNLQYLDLVAPALRRLNAEADVRLRIVSSLPWRSPGIDAEFVPWSPGAARDALAGARVGIAPLTDDPWTRGKCALRAIQYAGHALPVVASPVGITDRVVLDGTTGYLARSYAEWFEALRDLIAEPDRAARMGAAGLEHVRTHYSDEVAVRKWHRLLEELDGG